MGHTRSLAAFLLLVYFIAQTGDCNQSIYDIYFNGHCYWSEDVSYHVHHASGCKVYFTCQHGKFLDFKRCPESTVFNTETLQCDVDGFCKDETSVNPAYDAWWKKVLEVIDEFIEALENDSTSTSENAAEPSQNKQSESVAILSSPTMPQQMTKTEEPLVDNIESVHKDHLVVEKLSPEIRGSATLQTDTESTFDATKQLVPDSAATSIPVSNSKPHHSTVKPSEKEQSSVHIVQMQFDTQTSLLTESFSSYITPKPLPHEDISKTIDQINLAYLDALTFSSNSSKEPNFMTDFIFPLARDILKNSTIMSKVKQLFDVLLESAPPVIYQVLDQQVNMESGSTIAISLKELKEAWNRTTYLAYPIVKEILRDTMALIFARAAEHSDLVLDYLDEVDNRMTSSIPSVFGTFFDLVYKYRLLDKPSSSDQLKTYSLLEIRKDMKDISGILSNILSNSRNSM